jgi:hypothetical protein
MLLVKSKYADELSKLDNRIKEIEIQLNKKEEK